MKIFGDNLSIVIASTVSLVCSMFIPGIHIIIIYSMTGVKLKASTLKHENARAMEQRMKQNVKVLKMFAVITITFFILTIPYGVYNLCLFWNVLGNHDYIVLRIVIFLFFTNFCVNPIIYARMHKEISKYLRGFIHKIKRACCRCCSKTNQEGLLQ